MFSPRRASGRERTGGGGWEARRRPGGGSERSWGRGSYLERAEELLLLPRGPLGLLRLLVACGTTEGKKICVRKTMRSRNLPTCRAPAVARGATRERELARRSPRIDRGRRLDENEPDGDPVARARATALVRLPRERGFVQNRVLNEDAKMDVERKYRQGRRGAERAPRAISHVDSPPQRHQTPRAPSRRPSTRNRSQSPTDRARDGAASRSEPATRLPRRRQPASGQPTGSSRP